MSYKLNYQNNNCLYSLAAHSTNNKSKYLSLLIINLQFNERTTKLSHMTQYNKSKKMISQIKVRRTYKIPKILNNEMSDDFVKLLL